MSWYDVRDLLGHFVKPSNREGGMCLHRCCRGKRPHPDRFPLILDRSDLRRANEAQLIKHLERWGHRDGVVKQVTGELDRRELRSLTREQLAERSHHPATSRQYRRQLLAEANRRDRSERAKSNRASRDADYRAYLENEFVRAEEQTRGNMLNQAGERANIDPRSLLTGPESRVRKYASEELRRYFEDNRRVSRDEFFGGHEAQVRGARRRRESRLYGVY